MSDFGLYTQVSDSGPHGPLVINGHDTVFNTSCSEDKRNSEGRFLSSVLAEKWDIAITIFVWCMYVHVCVYVCVHVSRFVQAITSTLTHRFQNNLAQLFSWRSSSGI